MATQQVSTSSILAGTLGDFRWVRAHVSIFAVGTVLLVCANLLIGGSRLWSLTAVGIWSMLIVVHMVLLAIARLSTQLDDDEDEEIVLLPVKDAVFIDPKPDPTTTWTDVEPAKPTEPFPTQSNEGNTVSWQIATDAAQVKRPSTDSETKTT